MAEPKPASGSRGGNIFAAALFGAVAIRAVISYAGRPNMAEAAVLLASVIALYFAEPALSRRFKRCRAVYLPSRRS